MASQKKQEKRRKRAKAKCKASRSVKKATQSKSMYAMSLSMCPIHGPYTSDELCGCYDENGKLPDGSSYKDSFSRAAKGNPVMELALESMFEN